MNQYIKVVDGVEVEMTPEEIAEVESSRQAAVAQQVALAVTEYQRQRAIEYPPLQDYLDGIVKGDQAQIQTYIDACLVVKAKYQKPSTS